MISQKHSCSSNTVKLYKHLDKLELLQNGQVVPIMIHMMPTHRCQLNCVYCCFKNRHDRNKDMDLSVIKTGIEQFWNLGTRAVELTGGGDPTLYPDINKLIPFLAGKEFAIGVNTNAVDSQKVDSWGYCSWVRVSMNTLDYKDRLNLDPIQKSGAKISACYIWNVLSTKEKLKKVSDICNAEGIVCRIAPDCIQPLEKINESLGFLKEALYELKDNNFLFLSDFNITTHRESLECRVHMIKPCFYTDGFIYPCPSIELAVENNAQMPRSFSLCKYDEVYDFYTKGGAFQIKERTCSYCKYSKQQAILKEILTETEDNQFA